MLWTIVRSLVSLPGWAGVWLALACFCWAGTGQGAVQWTVRAPAVAVTAGPGAAPGRPGDKDPLLAKCLSLPQTAVLPPQSSLPIGVELRLSPIKPLTIPPTFATRLLLPGWLVRPGLVRGIDSDPSLQILFCTWLA